MRIFFFKFLIDFLDDGIVNDNFNVEKIIKSGAAELWHMKRVSGSFKTFKQLFPKTTGEHKQKGDMCLEWKFQISSNIEIHFWNPVLPLLDLRPNGNTDRSENLQIIEKLENILFYHFTTGTEFTLHIHLNCLPTAFEVRTLWIDVIAKNKPELPSTGTKIRRFVSKNSIYPRGLVSNTI